MRIFTIALAALALVLTTTAVGAAGTAALPSDVRDGLAAQSVEVGQPTGAPAQLPVSATRAKRIVKRLGFVNGHALGVYLVRVTEHPGPFDALPAAHGWTPITPLQVGDLAWIVVIRDATIPILGPPGGTYKATLVVIVETTRPKWVVGLTIT